MEETYSSRQYITTKYQRDIDRSAAKLLYIITPQKDNYEWRYITVVFTLTYATGVQPVHPIGGGVSDN